MNIFKAVFFFICIVLNEVCWAGNPIKIECKPEVILEGQSSVITVQIANSNFLPLQCFVTVTPPPATTSTQAFTLFNNSPITFTVNAVPDGNPGDYALSLVISCIDFPPIRKTLKVIDSDPIVDRDPHFSQFIVDSDSKQYEKICYDVTGKSGDYIEIYSHQPTKTYIYGQLMDDYYMHVIRIFSTLGNITVSTKYVKYNDELLSTWGESNDIRIYHRGTYLIKVDDKYVDIEVANSKDLKFKLTRSKHPITGYYMDFSVYGLLNYENIDGLLGRIGSNKIKFYNSVQNGNTERGTILVNGRFALATRKSGKGNCWSVDVKDVLHPYPIDQFVLRK